MPLNIFTKAVTKKETVFNLLNEVNSFNSIFDTKPLEAAEENNLEKMLVEAYQPGMIEEVQVQDDVLNLKRLTSEIKAIGKQCVILIGERVYRAREMLKPYRDGTFSKWLDSAFTSRKTGYNALSYYELYNSLPDDLKQNLRKLQHKTAYIIASKPGDIEIKAKIIEECQGKKHNEAMQVISEKLPSHKEDRRTQKVSIDKLILQLFDTVDTLFENWKLIEDKHRNELKYAFDVIDGLINDNMHKK